MTFLAGWIAAFAALAAVPVIIHLLNRRRFKVVRWGAIDFLRRAVQKTRRRLQMQDLILMLLRAAALALAALACARPALTPGRIAELAGGSAATAVIILDHSRSMGVLDGGETRFARAKARALAAVQALPRGSSAAVVLMSDVAACEMAEPSRDLGLVAGQIERARLSDGGTAVPLALAKAGDLLLQAGAGSREVVLVTDCQAAGWPGPGDPAWEGARAALRGAHLVVCDVGGEVPANAAVARLTSEDDLVAVGGEAAFVATIDRRGAAGAPLPVELWIDDGRGGDLRKVAAGVAEAGEGMRQVRLAYRFPRGGLHRLEVRIPGDALPADDRRGLVVDVVDSVRVCVVAQGPAGGFLRTALDAGPLGEGDEAREAIAVTLLSPDRLADLNLEDHRAIVLANLRDPQRLAGALQVAVADGRGLLLLPGPDSDPAAWNKALAPLLPGTLADRPRPLAGGDGALPGWATDRLDHPVTRFFAIPENQQWLAQPRFRTAWDLAPAEGATPLLRLSDGRPWLIERAYGRGTVLLAGGAPDRAWGDLPLRPAFVMLIRRLVQHAALGAAPRLNVRVHEPLRLPVPAREAQGRFTATDPAGGSQALTPATGGDGRPVVSLADTPLAGFYTLAREARRVPFRADSDPLESELAHAGREALQPCLGTLPTVWVGADEDLAGRLERARAGVEIWWLLLLLAVACLVAESILAARWAPKER